jgi:hypothetical protein
LGPFFGSSPRLAIANGYGRGICPRSGAVEAMSVLAPRALVDAKPAGTHVGVKFGGARAVDRETVRRRRIAVVSAVLTLSACGGKVAPEMSYTVAIDPMFTTSQIDAITAGLDDWTASIPELQLTYAIAQCDSPATGEVCMHPMHDPPNPANDVVGTTHRGALANAAVWIYVERIRVSGLDVRTLTEQTTAHEMGHAMGLSHSLTGELMAADVSDQAHAVTAADVDQFWFVRNP